MDFQLSPEDRDVLERARAFTEAHLFPHELEADRNGGISDAAKKDIQAAATA